MMKPWKNKNAIYQIYPRSFFDSNDDGVGDINGIINKIDYLNGNGRSLGVDAIWISPFFTSPMKDFGYDVGDYENIDPLFGSLDDMDELIHKAHDRNIDIMIDLVPNHTSNQHKWFREATASSSNSEKRDYYTFRDPLPDGSPPNNWLSVFGGSAWTLDDTSGQYYLHSFLPEQPDLNWSNPSVQEEMREILRFWFRRGIDGVRVDAVRFIAKNPELNDDPINPDFVESGDPYKKLLHTNSQFYDNIEEYLRVLTDTAKEFENKFIIFEDYSENSALGQCQTKRLYDISQDNASPFNFIGVNGEWGADYFSNFINNSQQIIPKASVEINCVGNHDKSRIVSRFGEQKARLLAMMQLTLPGVPVIYYGDELGMKDGEITPDKVRDPFEIRVPGKGLGRDPQRTPMQWSNLSNAGFTMSNQAWLPVNGNHEEVNVDSEIINQSSFLNLYKRLLSLRSQELALNDGEYKWILCDYEVLIYTRFKGSEKYCVVLNFNNAAKEFVLFTNGAVVCGTTMLNAGLSIGSGSTISLEPYEGLLIKI